MTSTRMHWVSGHRAGAGRGTVPVQEAQAGSLLTESRGASGPPRGPLLHSTCTHTTCTQPPGPHVQSALGPWGSVPRHSPYWSFRPVHAPRVAEFSQLLGQASVSQPHPGGPPAPFQAPGPDINRLGNSSRSGPFHGARAQADAQCGRAHGTIPPQLQHPEVPAVPGCSWPSHPRVPSSKATR